MSEYTPTMYQAQGSYVNGSMSKGRYEGNRARRRSEYRAEFHRWLAKERAAARREGQAEAWDEGVTEAYKRGVPRGDMHANNPYRNGEDRHVDQ